jgi:UDP-N-acetylmuramate dehydrogenase
METMKLQRNEPLRHYNTLALQATAEAFTTVTSDAELLEALAWARQQKLPVVPLGEGSNVVLAGDVRALVVRLKSRGIQVLDSTGNAITLRVAAGESWHELVQWSLQAGYYGLENLALIPGTVGAAPIQNIGAYGVELQSTLLRVHARKITDDSEVVMERKECEFGYRDSVFKRGLKDQLVITAVDFQLSLIPQINITYPALAKYFDESEVTEPTPQAVFEAVVKIRSSKLPNPALQPNAGSFFKNPLLSPQTTKKLFEKSPGLPRYPQEDGRVKVPAAWLIDHCGWKGVRRGNLGVHDQHALVLVNYGSESGESGENLLALATEVTNSVYDKFGVVLEIEPRVLGASE